MDNLQQFQHACFNMSRARSRKTPYGTSRAVLTQVAQRCGLRVADAEQAWAGVRLDVHLVVLAHLGVRHCELVLCLRPVVSNVRLLRRTVRHFLVAETHVVATLIQGVVFWVARAPEFTAAQNPGK